MAKIFLLRHGQCEDNARHILNGHRESSLTALGRRQIKAAARRLLNKRIKYIYASPLARTLETAKLVAETIGLPIVYIEPDLIERDFGFLTGHPTSDIPLLAKNVETINGIDYFFEGRGVETFPKVLIRAKRLLKKLAKQRLSGNILLVTHGDTGTMIKAASENLNWRTALAQPFWRNGEIMQLTNTL